MKNLNFQLGLQTSNLVISFMVWVILSSLMPFIKADIALTAGQISLVTAVPVILGSILRIPIGYWTNRYGARKLFFISFIILLFPVFYISMAKSMLDLIIGCLLVAFCAGIGNGTIFKLVPMYFSKQAGIVNGLVAALGGLGGFFPPLILTLLFQLTGHYAIGFMALSEVALACLIITVWMYSQEKLLAMLNHR